MTRHRLPRPARALAVAAAAATALAATAAPAAAQSIFTSRAAFLGALLTTGEHSLDGVLIPDPPGVLTAVPGLSFGFTTGDLLDPAPDPIFPTSVLGPAQLSNGGAGQSFSVGNGGVTRMQFASTVHGFGAQFFALASVNDVVFRFLAGGVQQGTTTFATTPAGTGYDGFYGVTFAGGFDQVDIEGAPLEFYEMDDLAAGVGLAQVVPEPSSLALLGAAGAALALGRRRRAGTTVARPEVRDA